MQYKVVANSVLYPEVKETGNKNNPTYKVLDTHINLQFLLKHFNAEIKYNLMTRKREVIISGHFISEEDYDNEALSLVEYLSIINDMPIKKTNEHLNKIAFDNAYHPIVDCIKNNKWDGVKRLDDFVKTIESTNQALSNTLIRTWMTAAIAAAHSVNGFTNHGALVLQGDQGIGKTAWVKSLDPVGCNAVRDGAILEPGNKDCVLSLSRFWIVELGELDATYGRTDIARIKSFITMSADTVRVHFARLDRNTPRRTAYIATVNKPDFLVDDTGNRRWWTISATKINYDHGMDMKQVWAEVYHEWKNENALTYLNREKQSVVNESNLLHQQIDPLEEKVLAFFDWSNTNTKLMTVTRILEEMKWPKMDTQTANRLSRILTRITGKEAIRTSRERLREVPATYNLDSRTN